ncbi:S41 family peptidase [Anaeromicropila populeti]|uniref:Carboxyl-terminal processing protease n=1 Tax=Anaeromicropila populeti TaxID=37658 RepID=A0A1I6IEK3_9FIRM|nr:S41 family peptidase [Anaeromicropila populeti]SFR65121.1 carboxyl-terminal processing protease [Anaeromicropila populeti]
MENKKFLVGFLTGITAALVVIYTVLHIEKFSFLLKDSLNGSVTREHSITREEKEQIGEKLTLLEQYIDQYYLNEISEQDIANGIYKGLVSSLDDPYSTYYSQEEYQSVMESTQGTYVGIGAYVAKNAETGVITIIKPYENGPAYDAGIQPGDIISKVNGESISGMDLNAVISLIKGEEDSAVTLEVLRGDESKPIEIVVTRQAVEAETITYSMLEHSVGYIGISSFKDSTVNQFKQAIDELLKEGMTSLIFDVRDNGGGALKAVVSMLDRILPEGMIVYTMDKNGEGEEYKSTGEESLDIPMVVLVNGNSASASEVFAGALQDYELATLVGTKTFGKGIVQSVFPLEDGSAIKLTTSKYYTPKGRNIHEIGILPDVEVELDESLKAVTSVPPEEDNQLQEAIKLLINEKK